LSNTSSRQIISIAYAGGPLQKRQTTKYMTMAKPTKRAIANSLYMSNLKLFGLSYGLSLMTFGAILVAASALSASALAAPSGSALFTRSRKAFTSSSGEEELVCTKSAMQRKRSAKLKLVKLMRSIFTRLSLGI